MRKSPTDLDLFLQLPGEVVALVIFIPVIGVCAIVAAVGEGFGFWTLSQQEQPNQVYTERIVPTSEEAGEFTGEASKGFAKGFVKGLLKKKSED